MAIFQNSFFSFSGQAERLQNVKNTLFAAITGSGVKSNVGIKPIDTALSKAASKPFITAAVVAGGLAVKGVQAPGAVKAVLQPVAKKAVTSFSSAKLSTQAVVVGGGIVGVNVLSRSPTAAAAVLKTPSGLANFGQNIGKTIEEPSLKNAVTIAKENPIITSLAAGAAVLATGVGAGSLANTIATARNTSAMNNATAATRLPDNRDLNDIAKQAEMELAAYKIQQDTALKAAKIQQETELELAKMQAKAAENLAKSQSSLASSPSSSSPDVGQVIQPKKPKRTKKKKKGRVKSKKKPKKKAKKRSKSKKYKKKKKKSKGRK